MFIKLYLVALPVFICLDLLWVGVVAQNFYREQIGFLMRSDVHWIAAILFYLIFITGLVVFVIIPGIESKSWFHILVYGALFGLVTYATYDLTNLALTKNWPLMVTIIDLIWGMVISTSVSLITYICATKWNW